MLAATIVGSLPKPAWLATPETLWAPWRLPPETLLEGQRGTRWSSRCTTRSELGIDVVTGGEQTRRHCVHGFAEKLEGIDAATWRAGNSRRSGGARPSCGRSSG